MIRDRVNVSRFEELVVPRHPPSWGARSRRSAAAEATSRCSWRCSTAARASTSLNPEPTRTIKAGDSLVVVGEVTKIAELRKELEAA